MIRKLQSDVHITGGAYCFTTTYHQRALLSLILDLLIVTKLFSNDTWMMQNCEVGIFRA